MENPTLRQCSQETRHIFVGRLWQQQVAQTKQPSWILSLFIDKSVEEGDEKRGPWHVFWLPAILMSGSFITGSVLQQLI